MEYSGQNYSVHYCCWFHMQIIAGHQFGHQFGAGSTEADIPFPTAR